MSQLRWYHCVHMTDFHSRVPNHFDLPRRINRLGELAYNLWWTWQPNAQRLFSRIDNDLWEQLSHNPILLIQQVKRSVLNEVAQDNDYTAMYDSVFEEFDNYLKKIDTWSNRTRCSSLSDSNPRWRMNMRNSPSVSGSASALSFCVCRSARSAK